MLGVIMIYPEIINELNSSIRQGYKIGITYHCILSDKGSHIIVDGLISK